MRGRAGDVHVSPPSTKCEESRGASVFHGNDRLHKVHRYSILLS